jgi:DNA-binding CsgD family transcriptional regulator/PAS domain-containing protein
MEDGAESECSPGQARTGPRMRLLHDPRLLSETVGAIYDCVLRPEGWQPLLVRLAELSGARSGFIGVSTALVMNGPFITHGLPAAEEFQRHAPYNPFLSLLATMTPDRAVVISRDFGLDRLQATRFHREYLGPRGDRDGAFFVVTNEGDAYGQWGLITPDTRPAITAEEIAGLELIAPHLRRAVEISGLLGLTRLEAATYRAALGELDAPVLILDGARRIAFANPRAAQEIESGRVLRQRNGILQGATDSAAGALRRLSQGGPPGFEGAVQGTDGQERLLFAVAFDAVGFDAAAGALPGTPGQAVLLVLRDPRQDTRNPIAIAARTFNLTPAQVQVLSFLAQGHAPDEIADIIGLSTATVRSHLSELFGRTGTSRQAELVARTLSLASPLRQDRADAG